MILSGILLARYKTRPLPKKYINLVRNIDEFEKYQWGRAAFEVLMGFVHKMENDLCSPSYVINGFMQVLQIRGYEAISLIAKKIKAHAEFASRDSIILKWKGSHARIDYFGLYENANVHHFIGNKDKQTIFSPRWSDEIHDSMVSNLIGCILSNYKFDKEFWVGRGLKVGISSGTKEQSSRKAKRKRNCEVQDTELDKTEDSGTQVFSNTCIEKLQKFIYDGFEGLSKHIEGVNTQIKELGKKVNIMQQSKIDGGKEKAKSIDSTINIKYMVGNKKK